MAKRFGTKRSGKAAAKTAPVKHEAPASWADLLKSAVEDYGQIAKGYMAFHNYSFGNMLLALEQCSRRNLPVGPINTYKGWESLGRQVQKGQKAIILCMPVTFNLKPNEKDADAEADTDDTGSRKGMRFVFTPRWFVLGQTEGEDVEMPAVPGWDRAAAMQALGVEEIPFEDLDGNTQGYSFPPKKQLAINPVAFDPTKTTFHELAHILLHDQASRDTLNLPRNLIEVEAEAVALLCSAALGIGDLDNCRGYIQHWYGQFNEIPEPNAKRIMQAADKILKAGATK